jgi:arylsulfatase
MIRSLIVLALSIHAAFAAASGKPNVIVIFTDDQGYGDVGCFGAKGFETPNLDQLAREGTRFTHFHVAQPVCSASRAGLLTGCYPNRLGIHGALGPKSAVALAHSETTLAEVFKTQGYATGMAGKWHLGDASKYLPVHHGFDEYLGLPYSNDMWPLHPEFANLPADIAKRKQGYPPLPMIEDDRIIDPEVTGDEQAQLTTRYTERAVNFIEKHRDQPFFFYLAHSMPHVPLFVSDKFKDKSKQGLYGDVIMEIDWSVGQIMATLRKYQLADNTLVIFTSDNGPWLSYGSHAGSAGPLREGKGTCLEGGTRVPCVMRWPGKIPADTRSDAMFMTIDLLPTLAKLIGAKLPELPIDGMDVWPIISGLPAATNPHPAYALYYNTNELQAVLSGDGRWKLLLPHSYRTLNGRSGGSNGRPVNYQQAKITQPELYDLTNDIGETSNIAGANPDVLAKLTAAAEKFRADLGDNLTKATGTGTRPPGKPTAAER